MSISNGDSIMSGPPERPWTQADRTRLLVWATAIICVSILWNQWILFQGGVHEVVGLVALVVFFIGVPLVFGALAGFLMRRGGPWRELLRVAGVGAACVALALSAQWVNDPRVCTPTPGSECDAAVSVGAVYIFAFCYVLLLGGAAAGKVVAARGSPAVAPTTFAPAVPSRTPLVPIGKEGWRWFSRTFRSGSPCMRVALAPLLVWAACAYVFVGAYVFDAAYWILKKVARVQAHRWLHVGMSVSCGVAYLVAIVIWGLTTPS